MSTDLPVIGNSTSLLAISLTRGQAKTIGFISNVDLPGGTYTVAVGETDVPVTQDDARTLSVAFPAENAALLWQQWRLQLDGIDFAGGLIIETMPGNPPGTTDQALVVNLGDQVVNLTVTIVAGAGMRAAATHRIPMVAGWNPTSLVPGIYAAGRVFLFGCAVADITPAPATPFQVIVEAAFAPGTPSDPSADDIPSEDAWFTVQDRENADIYGALLIPLDYLVAPYEAYLPPEFEGSYPFGQPIWYRGRSIDADGFRTVFNMFMPDGIPADPAAFPMVVFADGHKTTLTIDAPADDTSAGDPSEVTVDYEAIGTGLAPAARNVDARMAALVARIEALENP